LIHKGTRFLVLNDFDTTALVHWQGPMTSGLRCTIRKGNVVVAFSDSVPLIGAVTFVPEDSATFQRNHVPEEIRNDAKFSGISFVLGKREIDAYLKIL
jgi:hypothetical protein